MRKQWQFSRDPSIKRKYFSLSNKVKWELKKYRDNKWTDYISSLSASDNSLWRYLKIIKKPNKPIPTLSANSVTYEEDFGKVQLLADNFEKQFSPHPDTFCPSTIDMVNNRNSSFLASSPREIIEPATEAELLSIIKNLNNKKAPGYDNISNNAIKKLPSSFLKYILDIINAILNFAYFPQPWKKAIVIPIRKLGCDPSLPQNYRPISLLSSLSKLAEQVIYTRIQDFLNTHNILIPEQFGFRPKHSTTHQLLRVVEFVASGFQDRKHTGAIFLDIAKAFDRVWHSGLIYKLIKLKMPDKQIHLINSYLCNRSFVVRYNHLHSTQKQICSGVPHAAS